MKTGLSNETKLENMVSVVTTKYLEKFAVEGEDSKNQELSDFMQKHQNYNIKEGLKQVQHSIALELFNIRRVVDDGSFH